RNPALGVFSADLSQPPRREVGVRRHSGPSVEPDALARLARDRQCDAAPVFRDCVGGRLVLPPSRFRIGPVAEVADQRFGLRPGRVWIADRGMASARTGLGSRLILEESLAGLAAEIA